MKILQKMGGVSALIVAATFVVNIGFVVTILAPAGFSGGDVDTGEFVAFLADNQAIMSLRNQIIDVVFGIFLVVLSLALYERLKTGSSAMVQTATAFGLIWAGLDIASGLVANSSLSTVVDLYAKDPAQAASVWLALDSVRSGLGGGIRILGVLWVLLISWAALRVSGLPRGMSIFGIVVGVSGLLRLVPALQGISVITNIFGLGFIVWFASVGFEMLRNNPSTEA